jgi:hypothetical protein
MPVTLFWHFRLYFLPFSSGAVALQIREGKNKYILYSTLYQFVAFIINFVCQFHATFYLSQLMLTQHLPGVGC